MELPASQLIANIPASRDLEFLVGVEFCRLLVKIARAALEPKDHPLINRFPSFKRGAVGALSKKKADLFRNKIMTLSA